MSTALPWDTKVVYDGKVLPAFKDLPVKHGLHCAWSVWGEGDQLGTLNLLTPGRVAAAAGLVRDGLSVSLNLPLQFPSKPSFHRKHPEIITKELWGLDTPVRDDEIHMNSQSGTQWDGLRHFGVIAGSCFYQGVPASSIVPGEIANIEDPMKIDPAHLNLGIHHWAHKGITGRGVFLDMVSYYTRDGAELAYNPMTTHTVSLADIKACAAWEGVSFLTGDILLLRMGWTQRYYKSTQDERDLWGAGGNESFAGVENSIEMQEWLWENHFAAVASDMPAFEAWPPHEGQVHLHSTIIGMYGSPIGEFFDLELLSRVCVEKKRYTFFMVSNPLNILGGCASLGNASAIF